MIYKTYFNYLYDIFGRIFQLYRNKLRNSTLSTFIDYLKGHGLFNFAHVDLMNWVIGSCLLRLILRHIHFNHAALINVDILATIELVIHGPEMNFEEVICRVHRLDGDRLFCLLNIRFGDLVCLRRINANESSQFG